MFDVVEDCILQIEGVTECCIVGVPKDDDKDDVPIALVVTSLKDKEFLKKNILNTLEGKFDRKFDITQIYFIEKIFKTVTGKIQRNENKNLATELYIKDLQ